MKDTIIIGAGIAGLSAGYELFKDNIDFQILETSDKVGGNIETLKVGDYLIETGPNVFSSTNHEILKLISDLGIEENLIEANKDSKKRYVYLNNKLISLPTGLREFYNSEILSKDGKWTLFEELFIEKELNEESVEDFFTRRFGREALKNIIQPYLNGIYAGDIKKLSANAVFPKLKELENKYKSIILGSILSNQFKNSFKNLTLYSFNEGLEFLSKEIYKNLKNKITLSVKDIEISKAKDFFIVTFKVNNKPISYTTNSILFAIPAYRIPDFGYTLQKNLVQNIAQIEYAPIATATQVVEKSKIKQELDAFGFLCTREPQRKLLGTIWTSSIFPNRAPENKALLTSYIGGAHFKKITNQTEEEIKSLVTKEVAESLNISDPSSIETLHIKVHQYAIPQYNIGHLGIVKQIEESMNKSTGLFFTGNYLYGISINDTIKTSKLVVKKIKQFVSSIRIEGIDLKSNKLNQEELV